VNLCAVNHELRASDRQRDEAADDLREHFAAGRLSQEELDERIDAVYAARTEGELRSLRADLPALPATPASARSELAERRAQLGREMLQQVGGGLAPFLICTAIWAASGASGSFWPVWLLLIPLIMFVRNAWHLYGPAPELDRVEADLARRREHRRGPPGRHRHR
jgi:hypothetical protein